MARGLVISFLLVLLAGSLGSCGSDDTSADVGDSGVDSTATDGAGDTSTAVTQAELALCQAGDTCIVVPYDHCCGSTRRAINATHQTAYEAHPEWQSYHGDDCAMIGACQSDENLNSAFCDAATGTCTLAE